MSHTFLAAKPLLIGLSAMVLCCFAGGAGANTTTGPAYFVNDAHPGTYFKVGADGKDGGMTGWDKNDNCVSPAPNPKEGPAGAGAAGPSVSGVVTYAPSSSTTPFAGSIIVAASTGGTGGHGTRTDANGKCGGGYLTGGAGGAAGNVDITVNPGTGAPAGVSALTSSAIVAFSLGGSGGVV